MTTPRTFGGNFSEWSVGCPDGQVWDATAFSQEAGLSMLAGGDEQCGCEQSPHVLVWRDVPEWEAATS